jgi:hypothetical protein
LFSEAAALTTKEGAPTLFLFPLFPMMMDDGALLPLTETMLFRKEREKTDDDVILLLKNVCVCYVLK